MRTLLKVLGVIAIIVAGTAIMLTFAGFLVVRNIHVREMDSGKTKTVAIQTPFGEVKVHQNDGLNPEAAGIPIYPGAERSTDQGGAEFRIDAGSLHKDVTVSGATYYTEDEPEKVRAFYKDKFRGWNEKWENGEFKVESHQDGHIRTVQIKEVSGRTRIAVASIGPPAAN